MKTETIRTQQQLYYAAHCDIAADNHLKNAELQRQAGNERLAAGAEHDARLSRFAATELRNGLCDTVTEAYDRAEYEIGIHSHRN